MAESSRFTKFSDRHLSGISFGFYETNSEQFNRLILMRSKFSNTTGKNLNGGEQSKIQYDFNGVLSNLFNVGNSIIFLRNENPRFSPCLKKIKNTQLVIKMLCIFLI